MSQTIQPHPFQGRPDRWCEICDRPDRDPIHQPRGIPQERPEDFDYYRTAHGTILLANDIRRVLAAAARLIEADVTCEWIHGQTCHFCNATEQPHYNDCVYWLFVQAFAALTPEKPDDKSETGT